MRNPHKTSGIRPRKKSNYSDYELIRSAMLQSGFLGRPRAIAVTRIVPVLFWRKMSYFFEDYGCLLCGTESEDHCACGMCKRCYFRTLKRIVRSARRRLKFQT